MAVATKVNTQSNKKFFSTLLTLKGESVYLKKRGQTLPVCPKNSNETVELLIKLIGV